jgi:hypothetical protein
MRVRGMREKENSLSSCEEERMRSGRSDLKMLLEANCVKRKGL